MYEILKNSILAGGYDFREMMDRIHVMLGNGLITIEQSQELVQLAREHADPQSSLDIIRRLDDMDNRLRAIEAKIPVAPDPGEDPEYPNYVPGRAYRKGDKCTFKGKKYECILNEYTDSTLRSPEEYPAYWREVLPRII